VGKDKYTELMCGWHEMTIRIRWMVSVYQTSVHRCTRSIQVYIRLTHLVGELTTYKGGTKPQRLLNEGARHSIECMCIAHGGVIYAILT